MSQEFARHHWTHENCEVLFCYYKSQLDVRGYGQRCFALWSERNPWSSYTLNNICNQARSLLRRKVFTQVELDYIKKKATGQSFDTSSEGSEEEFSDTASVHGSMLASPTQISATPPVTSFTEYEQQLFDRVCGYMENLLIDDLCIMPNLRSVPFTKLKKITKVVDGILAYYKVISFDEVLKLLYCGARVVTDECGVQFKNKQENSSKPPWQQRIETKLQYLQKDLSQLFALQTHTLHASWKIKHLTTRYNLHHQPISSAIEQARQQIKVYSYRLKSYVTARLRRQQNNLFRFNRHTFYQTLSAKPSCCNMCPPSADTLQFWTDLWGKPANYNKKASWLTAIEHLEVSSMSSCNISILDFQLSLRRVANWKSPGPDCIHGFWVKYFTSLHPIILQYFNNFIETEGLSLAPSLLCGRTSLIMKNAEKECVPSN